ncbi:MAG: hypothetical protein F4Y45_10200 [Acidobacteria bacterium]|nr:hypothetical protein [Acidobacteriota bacterium]MXZ73080.1 hypothetical protein [Acidobacteriota bacterium]MYD71594.1 hypothetical protein [Acidobacteriota bacterium]MYJ04377.1 hypothetical protein [Acidobacteriota bacterium]
MNSKYTPLESHLRDSGHARVPMTFGEIEQVIGAGLPPAARRHRALWSNNPGNWVMTKAWLAAGYETEKVNMEKQRLVFRKVVTATPAPEAGGESSTAERTGSFADVLGSLKDTITISPGTNLTDPIGEDWNAAR